MYIFHIGDQLFVGGGWRFFTCFVVFVLFVFVFQNMVSLCNKVLAARDWLCGPG